MMDDREQTKARLFRDSPTGRRVIITGLGGHSSLVAASIAKHMKEVTLCMPKASEAIKQLEQAFRQPLASSDFNALEEQLLESEKRKHSLFLGDLAESVVEDQPDDRRHMSCCKANHVVKRGKGQRKRNGSTRWE